MGWNHRMADLIFRNFLILVCVMCWPAVVHSTEYLRMNEGAPVSAEDIETPIGVSFKGEDDELADWLLLPGLKEKISDQAPFWRDSKLNYAFRAYSLDRRDSNEIKASAITAGGRLEYESGWWRNLRISAGWYSSWEIDSKEGGGDTGLLAPGKEDIQVLGEANLQYRFTETPIEGSNLTFYRQSLSLPFINENDIRMLPVKHQGLVLMREDEQSLDYVVAHLTKVKNFDSDEFISMSRAAGAPGTDKGVTVVGIRPLKSDTFTFGVINQFGWDTFNTAFAEATFHKKFDDGLDLRLSGQVTDQRSVGDELVGDFDTWHAALQAALGWRGAVFKLAGAVTDDSAAIRRPWGGSPSYLYISRGDFDRAGEKAVLFSISYNPEQFSSHGLSGFINIARGVDARDSLTGSPLPDQTEYDLNIDFRPPRGVLKGFSLQLRGVWLDIEGENDTRRDHRIILNYSIPLL
jgi:hypothetical protein